MGGWTVRGGCGQSPDRGHESWSEQTRHCIMVAVAKMNTNHTTTNHPPASIVVVSYNTASYIESCLMALLELDYPEVEIIVVDNGSTDGSVELVRERFPDVELAELSDNKGFAGGASVGLYMASGEVLATVNPDVRLDPRWLAVIADTLMTDDGVGVVGSKILYPDGRTIQHAGGVVHYPLATTDHTGRGEIDHGQYDQRKVVSFVTGAALAMRREVGRALNFFDDQFFPVYYEDVDLCWRAKDEGYRVVYQPKAVAQHKESVTVDRRSREYFSYYHANRLRFVVKHYTPEQVMLDFLPAEAGRVSGVMPAEDRKASLDLLDSHPASPRVVDGTPTPLLRRREDLDTNLGEVMGGWRVREKPFRSSAPVIGGMIAKVREQINNLSTRWYVQPILRQQVEYNAAVARALREMVGQMNELQARAALHARLTAGMVAQQAANPVGDISTELESLRARLEELELELANLRQENEVS